MFDDRFRPGDSISSGRKFDGLVRLPFRPPRLDDCRHHEIQLPQVDSWRTHPLSVFLKIRVPPVPHKEPQTDEKVKAARSCVSLKVMAETVRSACPTPVATADSTDCPLAMRFPGSSGCQELGSTKRRFGRSPRISPGFWSLPYLPSGHAGQPDLRCTARIAQRHY